MKLILLITTLLFALPAVSKQYDYTTLMFQDYQTLSPIVQNSLRTSRKYAYPRDGDKAIIPLKKTLKLLFSRPNSDNLASKLSGDIIDDLKSMGIYPEIIGDLLKEAEEEITDKSLGPKIRTTSMILMKNVLLEIKPEILNSKDLALHVCAIADKNIKVPKEIKQDARLNTMIRGVSPTDLARRIMFWYAEQKNKVANQNSKGCPLSKKS